MESEANRTQTKHSVPPAHQPRWKPRRDDGYHGVSLLPARAVKRTTENGVHMCFDGWWRCRAEMVLPSKRIRKPFEKGEESRSADMLLHLLW